MWIDDRMRLERALGYLEKEKAAEAEAMAALEGIRIREIIIVRNKKRMYMAELDQQIRTIKARLSEKEGERA